MPKKQQKKKTKKEYRSIKEFKEHYLPKAYEKEKMQQVYEDPKSLGASMAQEHLERVRRELEEQK